MKVRRLLPREEWEVVKRVADGDDPETIAVALRITAQEVLELLASAQERLADLERPQRATPLDG